MIAAAILASVLFSTSETMEWRALKAITIRESGVRWRLELVELVDPVGPNYEADRYYRVHLLRNGTLVGKYGMGEPQNVYGMFFGISVPKIRAPFKVAAIRGHSGAGSGQQTLFIGFRDGKAFQMGYGSDAGEVGGPINYDGRSDLWLFDDYSWYGHYDLSETDYPFHRVLFQVDKDGKLRFVRKWKAPVRKRLPDTVGIRF